MAKAKPEAAAAVAAAKAAAGVTNEAAPKGFVEPTAAGVTKVNPPITDEAAAKKAEDKAAADKAKADAKVAKDKAAADKKAAAAEAKAQKDAERAQKKADHEAHIAQLKAEGKGYTGSMLSLADKVKEGVYVKGATGQLRSNDELAIALDGVNPTDVVKIGLDLLKLEDNPYAKLNVGQQSMNLRNRLRGAIKKETVKLSDIADYIARNKVHVINAETVAAEKQAKADAKAKAFFEAQEAKKAAAAKAEADKAAKPAGEAPAAT